MALTSALYTGLSGLNVNQTRLNVVGNNIANVNTVAFKSSRAIFKPQFYVTDGGGSPPSADFGGTNPSQRGLGATVAGIEKNFQAGSIEPTGKPNDLAIDGAGFFIVQGDEQRFTRDGGFNLNAANQLTTTGGEFVLGYGVDANYNLIPGQLQNLEIPLGATTTAKSTAGMTLEGNLNASGEVATGASILNSQALTDLSGGAPAAPTGASLLADVVDFANQGAPLFTVGQKFALSAEKGGRDVPEATYEVTATSTLQDMMDFFRESLGINTGVTAVPPPGATLETLAADDPASARLTLTGNVGVDNELSVAATGFSTAGGLAPFNFDQGSNAAGIESGAVGESVHTTVVGYDSLGTPLSIGLTAVFESSSDAGNVWRYFAESADSVGGDPVVGTGTLTFDSTGKLAPMPAETITLNRTGTGAKTPLVIRLDFDNLTSLTARGSDLVMTHQDGSPIGTLTTYSIGTDGKIVGSFSNGLTRNLGQLALAQFTNPQGLVDKGGNMFIEGASSGTPVISVPNSLGAGTVRSGALEMSNVDLSEEFINLIIASTGFSAASRVITTSDQLITELLNAAR